MEKFETRDKLVSKELSSTIAHLKISLIGMPASGKSALVKNLQAFADINYVSLGQITRRMLAENHPHATTLRELFASNEFWPDDFVLSIVAPELLKAKDRGFILDGIPKKATEAETLTDFMKKNGMAFDVLIDLEVDKETAKRRLNTRQDPLRLEQESHYEARFAKWEEERRPILESLGTISKHVELIDTTHMHREGVTKHVINMVKNKFL